VIIQEEIYPPSTVITQGGIYPPSAVIIQRGIYPPSAVIIQGGIPRKPERTLHIYVVIAISVIL
jgi:hypothetical protein